MLGDRLHQRKVHHEAVLAAELAKERLLRIVEDLQLDRACIEAAEPDRVLGQDPPGFFYLRACATVKEARRILAQDAVGFSSFDAGTVELKVLNDPEKPLFGQFGGQYSFMVNFALVEAVAKHLGVQTVAIEPQKEMVGRSLGTNVVSLMDLLAVHPSATPLKPWEQDRLIIKTIQSLNMVYRSPYQRPIEFPFGPDVPPGEREALQGVLNGLERDGVPDTIAYLTEDELFASIRELEALGYVRHSIQAALVTPPQPVDYYHLFFRP